jgi:3-hydroxyisobutyrate dehydrogenase-like beta-hydroxyacid dehydrogenase
MEKMGAKAVKCAKEIGKGNDVVIVMVLNFPQIKEVVLSPEGVLASMEKGSTLIVTSTISPLEMAEVEKAATPLGISLIDSPVSGGHERAVDGTLVFMSGAEKKVFDAHKDVLDTMGKYIYYTGGVTSGQTVKMINQLLCGAYQVAAAEALVLAKKLGMDLHLLHEIISNCTGDSTIWRQFGPRMIDGDYEPRASVDTMTKDTKSLVQTAMVMGAPILISSIPYQIFHLAAEKGLGPRDIASIVTIFEEYAGISICDS